MNFQCCRLRYSETSTSSFLEASSRLTPGIARPLSRSRRCRKAGGVYYTPNYIVRRIVQTTIGKWLEGKSPGARSSVNKLRVLDPACGSGSFLIGAYQHLLDWHRTKYIEDGPEKHQKELYQGPGGEWRLTT